MFQAQRGRSPIIHLEAFLPHMRGKSFLCPKSTRDLAHHALRIRHCNPLEVIWTHWNLIILFLQGNTTPSCCSGFTQGFLASRGEWIERCHWYPPHPQGGQGTYAVIWLENQDYYCWLKWSYEITVQSPRFYRETKEKKWKKKEYPKNDENKPKYMQLDGSIHT